MKKRCLLTTFLLLGFSISANAEVLFEQTSAAIGNPAASTISVSSSLADAIVEESQAYDNFSLASDSILTGLTWKGAFNNPFNPNDSLRGENDFKIRIHPDNLGAPDATTTLALFDLDGGTAGRNDGTDVSEEIVADELQREGGAVVTYSTDLPPLSLDAGSYWLSIQAIQTLPSDIADHDDPQWSWVFAESGSGGIFSYDEAFGDTVKPGVKFGVEATFAILGDAQAGLLGDFDSSGVLDAPDIDLLAGAVRSGANDTTFDLTNDDNVNDVDHSFWITDVKNTLPGDANLDQKVAFDDFLKLSGSFGKSGGWADGNFNTDTDVNFADFLLMSANFGKTTAVTASAVAPEPASAGLFGLALICVGSLRRRRSC